MMTEHSMRAAGKIAVTIAEFSTGGSERVAIRLANLWAAAGRRVTIFCGSEEGPTRDLVDRDVLVRPVMPRIDPMQMSRREIGRNLADQLRGQGYDAIVGPGNFHVPLLAALAGALPRNDRPAIVCKLSNRIARDDRSRPRQFLFEANLRRTTRAFDRLVAMSPALQSEARHILRRDDIACAPEPTLDDGRFAEPREGSSGMILCVGRLAPQKNFGLALEAFARLPRRYRLTMLGEGEEYPQLSAKAEALGIADRVHFAGYVGDVGAWLAHADALLSTSRFEGYPAALVEAIAARVPVVTTRCTPALPDIMFDESFGAHAGDDAAALAQALERVLEERRRPATAPLQRLAARHNGATAAESWLTVLDEAVTARATASRPRATVHAAPARAPLVLAR